MKQTSLIIALLAAFFLSGCHNNSKDTDTTGANSSIGDGVNGGGTALDTKPFSAAYKKITCDKLMPADLASDPVKAGMECGFVTVPADWKTPDGDTIKLAVYRLPSSAKQPAPDPVVYLEGGPGGAGISTIEDFTTGGAAYLRQRSDVIVIDQRGTGYSHPALYCHEIFLAKKNGGDIASAHKACHDRLVTKGVDPADYNSHNNALDVDAVRQAFGYKQWNLYGLSYGTRLALTAMRDASSGIRSVVLDSVFPPQINGLSEASFVPYWSIDQIVRNCETDPACKAAGGDVKLLIEQGIERLDANPVNSPDGTQFSAADYIGLLDDNIANPELLGLVGTVATGTDADIVSLLKAISSDGEGDSPVDLSNPQLAPVYPFLADTAQGMSNAVVCAEEWPYLNHKAGPQLEKQFSETTQRVVKALVASDDSYQCEQWNVPAAGLKETEAVTSSIPTLVLAGTADIQTPPPWSKLAVQTLSKGQYAEFPDLSHGLLGANSCVNEVTLHFLNSPGFPVDKTCIAKLPKVHYVVN